MIGLQAFPAKNVFAFLASHFSLLSRILYPNVALRTKLGVWEQKIQTFNLLFIHQSMVWQQKLERSNKRAHGNTWARQS